MHLRGRPNRRGEKVRATGERKKKGSQRPERLPSTNEVGGEKGGNVPTVPEGERGWWNGEVDPYR